MATKLKVYHQMEPRRLRSTVVLSVPDKQHLLNIAHGHFSSDTSMGFTGEFGYSLVHPKDRYVKKVGASVALAAKSEHWFQFVGVERRHDMNSYFKFIVVNESTGFNTEVIYKTHPNSQVVHTEFINVVKFKRA